MTRSTFAIPALVGVLSLGGLLLALTGDGIADLAASVALSVPVLATVLAVRSRQR